MSADRKPNSHSPNNHSHLLGLGIVVAGVAVATGGGYYLAESLDNSPKKPDSSGQLLKTPEAQSLSVKDLYSQSWDIDEKYNERRSGGESAKKIRNDLARLTLLKIDAIGGSHGANKDYSPVTVVDRVGRVIKIRDKEFDLDDETGLLIGGSLVEHFFRDQFEKSLKDDPWFRSGMQGGSYDVVDNVLWLADHVDLKIGDVAPLAHLENLEKLSQGLQALEKAGLTVPKRAIIDSYQYDDEKLYEDAGSDTILLRVNSYDGAFDAQGSVGQYVVANNGQLLDMYRRNLDIMFANWQSRITEERLLSPSDYASVYPDWIELGIAVEEYIYNGVGFRKRIAYAEATGHEAEAQLLWVKYQTISWEGFGDQEFSIDGKPKEVRDYQIGDIVKIDDYEGYDRPGILLREASTFEIDPNRPSVGDESEVRVLEGPVVVINHQRAQATKIWRVQAGNITGGRVFIDYDGKSGWVSEEWFGQKFEIPQ